MRERTVVAERPPAFIRGLCSLEHYLSGHADQSRSRQRVSSFCPRYAPITILMTYACTNPVLALFLGWLLLHEPVTSRTVCGAGLVVLSVFAIFHVRKLTEAKAHRRISQAESAPFDEA